MKQYLISVRYFEGKGIVDSVLQFDETELNAITTAESTMNLTPEMQQVATSYVPFMMRAHANGCEVYSIVTDLPLVEVEEFLINAREEASKWRIF